jgi:Protein of unknown function (DUF3617)
MSPRISIALLAVIGLTLTVAPLSAADRMKTGQWEFTSTTPKGETHTFKHCVTPDETGGVNGDTRSARAHVAKRAVGCTITYYKVDGNTVSYTMICGPKTTRSTTTYHGDTFEADMTTKVEGEAEIVTHVKARRLGPCP